MFLVRFVVCVCAGLIRVYLGACYDNVFESSETMIVNGDSTVSWVGEIWVWNLSLLIFHRQK